MQKGQVRKIEPLFLSALDALLHLVLFVVVFLRLLFEYAWRLLTRHDGVGSSHCWQMQNDLPSWFRLLLWMLPSMSSVHRCGVRDPAPAAMSLDTPTEPDEWSLLQMRYVDRARLKQEAERKAQQVSAVI
jgi:hypothetical protein